MPSNSDGACATVPRVKSTNSYATLEPLPDQPMTDRESGSNATEGHACLHRACDRGPMEAAGYGELCRPGGRHDRALMTLVHTALVCTECVRRTPLRASHVG
jgi:hypothetical protein